MSGWLLVGLSLAGCAPHESAVNAAPPRSITQAGDQLALGVIHRAIATGPESGIDLIDVDLDRARAHWTIQTRGIRLVNGHVIGQAFTPREWLTRLNGLGAVNGGYFGNYEDENGRKDFVGLLVQGSKVRHAAPPLMGEGSAAIRRGQYIRSAFGLTSSGLPRIDWAATELGRPQALNLYNAPMGKRLTSWRVAQAVGCGPTLITGGKIMVTDLTERLVSPGPLPRTFVAYDDVGGKPQHLLIGIASSADFPTLGAWIHGYFPHYDGSRAQAAMCLDGGASTQMTYSYQGSLESPRDTGVTVPDALVLLPTR